MRLHMWRVASRRPATCCRLLLFRPPASQTPRAYAQTTAAHREGATPTGAATAVPAAVPKLQPQQPAHSGPKLRPYQEECVTAVLHAFKEGRRQVGVSLATGAGKTVIFTELISRMPPPRPKATQTLILVHRQELAEQAAKHCRARYPDKTVEVELGALHATGTADITVASVQSINSRDRIHKFDAKRFKLILVDEAHHIVASTYLRILGHFGLQDEVISSEAPALVGVSATFGRHDGLALGKAIKHIVYHKDYVDMIGEAWLSDVMFTSVKSQARLSNVKTSKATGDFLPSSLSEAINTPEINLVTVRAWLHRAHAQGRNSTLVFCVDLAHLTSLTAAFRAHGVDARFVTGDTPRPVRMERLNAFRSGDFPVLLNCGVFTEGTDIPNIDCVLLARPTKSRNLLVQMIGRGMRLHPGKANCHIIDMVASLEGGIVTTPSLFGLDPDAVVEAASRQDLQKAKDCKDKEKQRDAAAAADANTSLATQSLDRDVTFTDYDSVNDLISDTSGERHIRALSQNAWVNVGPQRYVLTGGAAGSYLVLERDQDDDDQGLFKVRYTARLPPSGDGESSSSSRHSAAPYMRPRTVATAETLEAAVRAADHYASRVFVPRLTTTRLPAAAWRREPATASQLDFLNRLRDEARDGLLGPADLNKGEAGDAITKVKFGARGRFASLQRTRRRRDRQTVTKERERRRGERAVVRVGPVSAIDDDA